MINTQYFYYYLLTLNLPAKVKGSQPFISVSDFSDIKISIPPLTLQEKIVNVLDKFDNYTNSIESGLKGEIEKNNQRYEYWWDKLLSFEKED